MKFHVINDLLELFMDLFQCKHVHVRFTYNYCILLSLCGATFAGALIWASTIFGSIGFHFIHFLCSVARGEDYHRWEFNDAT